MMKSPADVGLIGLAVMGQNLALNMADKGFTVAVYNRTNEVTREFLGGPASEKGIFGTEGLRELAEAVKRPRRIMLMVRAGPAVDAVIEQLAPYLAEGDIIIDGGNSNYQDSTRRTRELEAKGLLFVGAGVSGGEEGARHGPSIMPGGSKEAWPHVKELLQSIAAQVEGVPCCDWVGEAGAGHYVKMVHNGIEYGDMQLIAEGYHLLREGLGLDNDQLTRVFDKWYGGVLDSYLIEITRDILAYRENGEATVDVILDSAGQKGTGRWTSASALELGVPLTLISEAVFARFLSAMKDERGRAAKALAGPQLRFQGEEDAFVDDLEQALYASKIVSYTQGFMLMRSAAAENGWQLNLGSLALMWRGGCIIRSVFLNDIKAAFDRDPDLPNLLLDPFFANATAHAQDGWRRTVARAASLGLPVPATGAALAFYDGYRHEWLPANLIQAQRDYFGAHTYERIDRPRGEHFHTNWTGRGGSVSAESYQA